MILPVDPIAPMLAVPVEKPFDSEDHLFEVKWDGYRTIAFLDGKTGHTRLQSRNLRDISHRYPGLGALAGSVRDKRQVVLDGEVVALKDGMPSFSDLQRGSGQVVYVAFDMLWMDGRFLVNKPLIERRERLEAAVRQADSLIVSSPVMTTGRSFYDSVVQAGLEGIVAKSLQGPYLPGKRSRYWLKVRHTKTMDLVIVGYSLGSGGEIASLALALYDGGHLRYTGRVGSGLGAAKAQDLARGLRGLNGSPQAPLWGAPRDLVWVEPRLVCEVEYLEMTPGGGLRHPVYKGLRRDKDARECIFRG